MNVKCPNCRYKFDVNPIEVDDQNEVNCTCPRCGTSFTTQYVAPAANHPVEGPVQQPSSNGDQSMPSVSGGQEADLYFAVMKRMKEGQYEEAGAYLSKLLELKPNDPIYLDVKEQLDGIKQSYLLATRFIQSGDLNSAVPHVNRLLEISPYDPMIVSLRDSLLQAQQQEMLRQEELRRQEEERRREEERIKEEERKREEAIKEAERKKEEEKRQQEILIQQKEEKKIKWENSKQRFRSILMITMIILACVITLSALINCISLFSMDGFASVRLFIDKYYITKIAFIVMGVALLVHFVTVISVAECHPGEKKDLVLIFALVMLIFIMCLSCYHAYFVNSLISRVSHFNTSGSYLSVMSYMMIKSGSGFVLLHLLLNGALWFYFSITFWKLYQMVSSNDETNVAKLKKAALCWASVAFLLLTIVVIYVYCFFN